MTLEQWYSLQWRHNKRAGVSNHRRLQCLLNCWFRCGSKKTPKLRVTGLCEGNSPVTGEFPAQRVSNAEKVSIWWRHHDCPLSPWSTGIDTRDMETLFHMQYINKLYLIIDFCFVTSNHFLYMILCMLNVCHCHMNHRVTRVNILKLS